MGLFLRAGAEDFCDGLGAGKWAYCFKIWLVLGVFLELREYYCYKPISSYKNLLYFFLEYLSSSFQLFLKVKSLLCILPFEIYFES